MQEADASTPRAPRPGERWRRALAACVVLVTLGALALTLSYVIRDRHAELAAPDGTPRGAPLAESPLRHDESDARLRTLEQQQGELDARIQAFEVRIRDALDASSPLVERLTRERTAALAVLSQRLGAIEARLKALPPPQAQATPARPPAPGDGDLEALRDRLYQVEVRLQREGEARLRAQEEMAQRLYNVEKSRDRSDAQRLAAEEALRGRLYNVEQRFQAMEERAQAFEQRTIEGLERLEAQR